MKSLILGMLLLAGLGGWLACAAFNRWVENGNSNAQAVNDFPSPAVIDKDGKEVPAWAPPATTRDYDLSHELTHQDLERCAFISKGEFPFPDSNQYVTAADVSAAAHPDVQQTQAQAQGNLPVQQTYSDTQLLQCSLFMDRAARKAGLTEWKASFAPAQQAESAQSGRRQQ